MNSSTEQIRRLFLSFNKGERDEFIKAGQEIIDREKQKNHHALVRQLEKALYAEFKPKADGSGIGRVSNNYPVPCDKESGFPLLAIKTYQHFWEELILPADTENTLKQIVEEVKIADILRGYNLQPKSKILLCGEPGTGKTFTAQVFSSVVGIPLVQVQFDAIVSSYLGETATNLRKVFDFLKTGVWIVIFDEFDIIGKNRDDHHEHGEIKRVVNNFLQMLDAFEGESIIFAATNHHHILDPAIWRRFDEVILFEKPDQEHCKKILELFLRPIEKNKFSLEPIARKISQLVPSDIKMIAHEAMKRAILDRRTKLKKVDVEYGANHVLKRKSIKKEMAS